MSVPAFPKKRLKTAPARELLFIGRVRGEARSRHGLPRRSAPRNDLRTSSLRAVGVPKAAIVANQSIKRGLRPTRSLELGRRAKAVKSHCPLLTSALDAARKRLSVCNGGGYRTVCFCCSIDRKRTNANPAIGRLKNTAVISPGAYPSRRIAAGTCGTKTLISIIQAKP